MITQTLHCPNCSAAVEGEPVRCRRCGYRSEMAGEYFWVYAGGGSMILLGFLLGALGVAAEGKGAGHWSRSLEGWFPLAPWPEGWHWLSFLVAGIIFTLGGMGITRGMRSAWAAVFLLVLQQTIWSAIALAGAAGGEGARSNALPILLLAIIILLVLLRIGAALLRTPSRRRRVMAP